MDNHMVMKVLESNLKISVHGVEEMINLLPKDQSLSEPCMSIMDTLWQLFLHSWEGSSIPMETAFYPGPACWNSCLTRWKLVCKSYVNEYMYPCSDPHLLPVSLKPEVHIWTAAALPPHSL